MTEFIAVPKLNKVLDVLATNPFVRPIISEPDLLKELKRTGMKIELSELHSILEKLVAESYVKREGKTVYHNSVPSFTMYFSIKAEGLVLNKNGGFSDNEASFEYQPAAKQNMQNAVLNNGKTIAATASNSSLFFERAAWIAAILGTLFLLAQCFKIWPFAN
jgi:hypothetical protein